MRDSLKYWPWWLLLGAIIGIVLVLRFQPMSPATQAYRRVRRKLAMRWLEEPVRQVRKAA